LFFSFKDGFYDGKNLEGRYGLIPSNFIELVTNLNDIPENTKYIIQKLTGKIFANNERNSRQREQTFSIESDVFTNNPSIPIPKLGKTKKRFSSFIIFPYLFS
jgi:hypothetical protein